MKSRYDMQNLVYNVYLFEINLLVDINIILKNNLKLNIKALYLNIKIINVNFFIKKKVDISTKRPS